MTNLEKDLNSCMCMDSQNPGGFRLNGEKYVRLAISVRFVPFTVPLSHAVNLSLIHIYFNKIPNFKDSYKYIIEIEMKLKIK